jgi:folate-dependent phosphoribosylglycinamide formyltransferase PurN
MAAAEARRPQLPPVDWISGTIKTNQDLLDAIRRFRPRLVFLFRAGLIVNSRVIAEGADILNFHCASIHTHGGLASIRRALDERVFEQTVTLHRVTTSIDDGEILAVQPYLLDPAKSYFWNEQTAYSTGIAFASRVLRDRANIAFKPTRI